MKKRILAMCLASASILAAFSGCNSNNNSSTPADSQGTSTPDASKPADSSTTDDSKPGDTSSEAPSASAYEEAQKAGTGELKLSESEGKVYNIYCWNGDFQKYVEKYYKAPEGVKFEWHEIANNDGAYQTALDAALQEQESAEADKKVDLFLAEADYIKKYVNTSLSADVKALGVEQWDTGYDYTYKAATSEDGVLKGVSWQANPSMFIYRRSIAKEVLGTDDPAEVQKELATWEKVEETAAKAKEKGYYMFASPAETYRIFANNSSESFINGDTFAPTKRFDEWAEMAKKFVDNGWSQVYGIWDNEKQAMMGDGNMTIKNDDGTTTEISGVGQMMCCVGPAWYFNFCMGNAIEKSNGDWAICVGPEEHFWGGTWLVAATGSDNPEVTKDLMNAFTANEQIAEKILTDAMEFPNNTNVVDKYASKDDYGLEFLGGQNHIKVMAESAKKIVWDPKLHTMYDQMFNEDLASKFLEWFNPANTTVNSREEALNAFYVTMKEKAPQLKH